MVEPAIRFYADVVHSYGRGVLRGISDYTKEYGGWDIQFDSNVQPGFTNNLSRDGTAGIIINLRSVQQTAELIASGLPAVNVSNMLAPVPAVPAVFVDDHAVGQMAAEYFRERGFCNFAFAGVDGHRFSDLRALGFFETLGRSGFSVTHLPGGTTSPKNLYVPTFDAQRQNRTQLLSTLPRPVGIFCANDICGKEVIRDAVRAGLRLPDQVAVLGVDNDEIFCELSGVQLSSIRVNSEQVGYVSAELLATLMQGKKGPTDPILIPPLEVITRRSTDILPLDDPEVAAVVRFIRDRGGRDINVEDLLARTSLSRRSLEMRFRKALGRSPYQEIRRVQMERAKVMLSRAESPLREIADACGFKENRRLRVSVGEQLILAPRQYRRRNRGQTPAAGSVPIIPPNPDTRNIAGI